MPAALESGKAQVTGHKSAREARNAHPILQSRRAAWYGSIFYPYPLFRMN